MVGYSEFQQAMHQCALRIWFPEALLSSVLINSCHLCVVFLQVISKQQVQQWSSRSWGVLRLSVFYWSCASSYWYLCVCSTAGWRATLPSEPFWVVVSALCVGAHCSKQWCASLCFGYKIHKLALVLGLEKKHFKHLQCCEQFSVCAAEFLAKQFALSVVCVVCAFVSWFVFRLLHWFSIVPRNRSRYSCH